MSCEIFFPSDGEFTEVTMAQTEVRGWKLTRVNTVSATLIRYEVSHNNVRVGYVELTIPDDRDKGEYSEKWGIFGYGRFLAVFHQYPKNDGTTDNSFKIEIYDLHQDDLALTDEKYLQCMAALRSIPVSYSTNIPKLYATEDGKAVFIFKEESTDALTHAHSVHQTLTGEDLLPNHTVGTLAMPGKRLAYIDRFNRTVGIRVVNGSQDQVIAEDPLPSGKCNVWPPAQHFGTRTVSAMVSVGERSLDFSVSNDGNDNLEITGIGSSAPFTVESISNSEGTLSFPVCLKKMTKVKVRVKFKPTGGGNFSADLPIYCTPQLGTRILHCTGTGRMPEGSFSIKTLPPVNFGLVFASGYGTRDIVIVNSGDAELKVIGRLEGKNAKLFTLLKTSRFRSEHFGTRLYTVSSMMPHDGSVRGNIYKTVNVGLHGWVQRPGLVTARVVFYRASPAALALDEDSLQTFPLSPLDELGSISLVGRIIS